MVKEEKKSYYLRIFRKNRLLLLVNIIMAIITSAATAGIALLLKNIIDIAVSGDIDRFTKTFLFNLGYLAGFALLYYTSSILSKLLLKGVIRTLRQSVFSGILKRSYHDFYEVNTADYISVLTNDIKLVEENYIAPLMGIVENLFSFLFTFLLLIKFSPLIVLILFIGLILMVVLPGLIGQSLQKKQEVLSGAYSLFTSKIKDIFSGFEVIRAFGLSTHMNKQFTEENASLAGKKYEVDRLFVLNEVVSQFLAVFTQIITIFAAAFLVIKGNITIGSLIAIMQLAATFVMPLVYLMQNFPKLQSVVPVMRRMQEFDDYTDTSFTGRLAPEFKEKIIMNKVSFAYQEGQPVLNRIQLELMKGKKYAIVGESGCGKTTLIKLLSGYDPNYSGEILYDNVNLKECDINGLCQMASVIHQNVYLFDRTIRDNICLFRHYSQGALDRAVMESGVDKFLPAMSEGLDTVSGENGANLSGGQRQRIAIARALIKETPILILDEGTSAIDLQTSNEIERKLLQDRELTLITITHKMNKELLTLYDRIIYMEQGSIVEMGSYEELYSLEKGFYHFCAG